MKQVYDVIIVGAGNIGLSCALALLEQGIDRIAVLEAKPLTFDWQPNRYDLRVSALNLGVFCLLNRLQVWPQLAKQRVSPFVAMEVFDSSTHAQLNFCCDEVQEPALGYIVENQLLQKTLLATLQQHPQVTLITEAKIKRLQSDDSYCQLTLDDSQRLQCRLLVGADGAHSFIRTSVGFDWQESDYQQRALVGTIYHEKPHLRTARQWFLPQGPLALLPLNDEHHSSMVWSSTPEHIAKLETQPEHEFNVALEQASEYHLGKSQITSERRSFPLIMRFVKPCIKPRIALIGDAAHTIHPLAGQGANLGFADADTLARTVGYALSKQRDIGAQDTLARYARARYEATHSMILAMQGIKYLFGTEHPILLGIRSLGLNVAKKTLPIKRSLIRHALYYDIV